MSNESTTSAAPTATKAAQELAEATGIDLSTVKGSSPGGIVNKKDVEAAAKAVREQNGLDSGEEGEVAEGEVAAVEHVPVEGEVVVRTEQVGPHVFEDEHQVYVDRLGKYIIVDEERVPVLEPTPFSPSQA